MLRQLLWKEWRENLWKLVFCGAVSLAFTALLFRIRLFPDSDSCGIIFLIQMLVVPTVYALDIFSGEMSNRTIHLLFKFPVPRWKIFFSKYLVCVAGMCLIFLSTGSLMELISRGRETDIGFFFEFNLSYGVPAIVLFTWFCAFGAQSRSEAGSLAAMFGVFIGWGIVFFWSGVCDIPWAAHFVPYLFIAWAYDVRTEWFHFNQLLLSQFISVILVLAIACYRFVKVRRVL